MAFTFVSSPYGPHGTRFTAPATLAATDLRRRKRCDTDPAPVGPGTFSRMGKQLFPVPVRMITPSAVIDGVLFADDGNFWDAWAHSPTGEYGGRRVYQATVYPLVAGAAPIASPVAAVNEHDLLVVAIIDPAAAARAIERAPRFKHSVRVTALTHTIAVSGTVSTPRAALEPDQEPLEHGLVASAMTDVTIRSLDAASPFECAAPFAYLTARGKHVVLRDG